MQEVDLIKEFSFNYWIELGIAVGVAVGAAVWKLYPKKKEEIEDHMDWRVHSDIHEQLTELRVLTDAARAQLIRFHNGEYFMDGVSMRKLSLTHESVSRGVAAEGDKKTNLLISLFAPLIEKIINNSAHMHFTSSEREGFHKSFMEISNVNSFMVLPVKYKNNISGYLMLQWCSPTKTKKALNNIVDTSKLITDARDRIQVLLEEQTRVKK
jgi:transcriptional regulator with GAF, ATPase, and Fis domain